MRKTFLVATMCAAALAPAAASAAPAGHGAKAASAKITVTASDFKFKLTKMSVAKGTTVTFTVKNTAKITHNFKIDGKVTPMIKGGKSATLKVKFTKAGKFPYLCTVPGHAAAGMKGTFTVK
jgi:plastocyanin